MTVMKHNYLSWSPTWLSGVSSHSAHCNQHTYTVNHICLFTSLFMPVCQCHSFVRSSADYPLRWPSNLSTETWIHWTPLPTTPHSPPIGHKLDLLDYITHHTQLTCYHHPSHCNQQLPLDLLDLLSSMIPPLCSFCRQTIW